MRRQAGPTWISSPVCTQSVAPPTSNRTEACGYLITSARPPVCSAGVHSGAAVSRWTQFGLPEANFGKSAIVFWNFAGAAFSS